MELEELSDDELIEELLCRQGKVSVATAEARMQVAIEAANGDERQALQALERARLDLVETALNLLTTSGASAPAPSLAAQAHVIWAHDLLLERLEPDGEDDDES
jgi:hypothetical protein